MAAWLKATVRRLVPRAWRNRLRSPRRSLRWWWNERAGPTIVTLRPGWQLTCPRNALDGAFFLQLQDPPQVQELDEFIALVQAQPRTALLDLGSHFGVFSLAVARYGQPGSHALAVDPSPLAAHMVQRLAALNGVADQLRFQRAAAGAVHGELELVDTGTDGAGYLVLPTDHPAADRTRVPVRTLAELAAELGETPTIIKIDVESYEREVLQGGREFLRAHEIPLALELHNTMLRARQVDPVEVTTLLGDCGYRRFQVAGREVPLAALTQGDVVRCLAWK